MIEETRRAAFMGARLALVGLLGGCWVATAVPPAAMGADGADCWIDVVPAVVTGIMDAKLTIRIENKGTSDLYHGDIFGRPLNYFKVLVYDPHGYCVGFTEEGRSAASRPQIIKWIGDSELAPGRNFVDEVMLRQNFAIYAKGRYKIVVMADFSRGERPSGGMLHAISNTVTLDVK